MSLFNFKYPYTNFHEINLDWVIEQIINVGKEIDAKIEIAIKESKDYTDNELSKLEENVSTSIKNLNSMINNNTEEITKVRTELNTSISNVNQNIQEINNSLLETIAQLKNYVDSKNIELYQRILEEISVNLQNLKVVNYFTGELVTIQQMFDILAQKHLDAPITYDEMVAKNNTYDDLLAYNVTYTDFNNRADVIMVQK